MFEKIVAGECDTNDPVWLGISQEAQDLVVSPVPVAAISLSIRRKLPGYQLRLTSLT